MKILFIITSLIFITSLNASEFKVPKDWIQNSQSHHDQGYDAGHGFLNQTASTSHLSRGFQRLMNIQEQTIHAINLNEKKNWYLQSIKTELAIGGSGHLGLMGIGGEAAIEFIWLRNKKTIPEKTSLMKPLDEVSPNLIEETESKELEEIRITENMSPSQIKKEINPIVDFAFATGRIKRKRFLARKLLKKALEFQKITQEINSAPQLGPWYAYKFQLELGVSVEGKITPFFEVGNALRLRLEWYKIKREKSPLLLQPPLQDLSQNAEFVTSLIQDMSSVKKYSLNNNFILNFMKIGVGTSVSGNLLFVKSKAQATGSLFFRRNENESLSNFSLQEYTSQTQLSNYKIIDHQNNTFDLSRRMFRKGAQKAFNILHFFAARIPPYDDQKKFNLNVLEAEFEIATNGGIGLVTVEGQGGVTLFATRNINI